MAGLQLLLEVYQQPIDNQQTVTSYLQAAAKLLLWWLLRLAERLCAHQPDG